MTRILFPERVYPPEAECIAKNKYEITSKVPSKFIDGLEVDGPTILQCPRCRQEMNDIDHGKTGICPRCGLMMQVFGNGLHFWDNNLKSVAVRLTDILKKLKGTTE